MLVEILFYVFAALALGGALLVLLTKRVLHAAFALMLVFLCMAALYVLLGADFVGITQLLVYVGGILILLVFGVMLTNRLSGAKVVTGSHNRLWGVAAGAGMFFLLFYMIANVNFAGLEWITLASEQQVEAGAASTVKPLGVLMMGEYVLGFEVAGVILLVALVAAAFIARQGTPNSEP